MKITKKIQAAKDDNSVQNIEDKEPVLGNNFDGKYASAQDAIMTAIKELTAIAKDGDAIAKDSIANLSVVLLDLQGNK